MKIIELLYWEIVSINYSTSSCWMDCITYYAGHNISTQKWK